MRALFTLVITLKIMFNRVILLCTGTPSGEIKFVRETKIYNVAFTKKYIYPSVKLLCISLTAYQHVAFTFGQFRPDFGSPLVSSWGFLDSSDFGCDFK